MNPFEDDPIELIRLNLSLPGLSADINSSCHDVLQALVGSEATGLLGV
jgi:hypothetical protein